MGFERALLERVRSLPGVVSAGAIDYPPFMGGSGSHVEIAGHPQNPNEPTEVVFQTPASSGYLETMGIPLLRGRRIRSSDDQSRNAVCDIDETVATKFFAHTDPMGMQVVLPVPKLTCTVVGVVGATKFQNLVRPPRPRIYYSSQMPVPQISLVVKVVRDSLALVSPLRHEVAALNSNLPLSPMTMNQILADSLARQRFSIQLMTVFALIAALLAAIGIYGVLAYLVDQRRRELGIRMALGARASDVVGLVLRQGSLPVGIGLMCGIGGALAMTRYLNSLLYEISSTDPLIFTGILVGLALVALLAMSVPAYRATRVEPLEALRDE
jgi:predicted permease